MPKSSRFIAVVFVGTLNLSSAAETSDRALLIGFRLAQPPNSALTEKLNAQLNAKLDAIWIPEITFADASLREAVDMLKKYSVENDTDSRPGNRGINVVLKRAMNDPKSEGSLRVTLRNVTFRKALQQIADQFGLKIEMDRYAVVLTDQ